MNLILLIFLPARGLVWQACLKKTRVKSELLSNSDMLMMVEKGIRGGIYIGMQKQIISICKIIIKTLHHHTSCI